METLSIIFEIVMIVCFGASWPFNIVRAYKARTAKGTSLLFTLFIAIGYVGGILCKIFQWQMKAPTPLSIVAFCFYILNICMVSTGIAIYFRNKKLDAAKEKESK